MTLQVYAKNGLESPSWESLASLLPDALDLTAPVQTAELVTETDLADWGTMQWDTIPDDWTQDASGTLTVPPGLYLWTAVIQYDDLPDAEPVQSTFGLSGDNISMPTVTGGDTITVAMLAGTQIATTENPVASLGFSTIPNAGAVVYASVNLRRIAS